MSLLSLPTLAERGRRNSENTIIGIKAFRSSEENGNSVPPYSMALLYEIKKVPFVDKLEEIAEFASSA